jgi:hypothetical protein
MNKKILKTFGKLLAFSGIIYFWLASIEPILDSNYLMILPPFLIASVIAAVGGIISGIGHSGEEKNEKRKV